MLVVHAPGLLMKEQVASGVAAAELASLRRDVPEYRAPSTTAVMAGMVHALQWMSGTGKDWLAACFTTMGFAAIPGQECHCAAHKGPPLLEVWRGLTLLVWLHPVESFTYTSYLHRDVSTRTQVLDSILRKQVTDSHIDQVVILGAGMDTRSYRKGVLSVRKIFETDLVGGLALKQELLRKCNIEPARGPKQVTYMHLNLLNRYPFNEVWEQPDFIKNGNTLVVCEQVFAYMDVFSNMNWLHRLRAIGLENGGTVTLVLLATRGPNFDMSSFPRCVNREECLNTQMPNAPAKSEEFMSALGWRKNHSFDSLERPYMEELITDKDSGYAGVFNAFDVNPHRTPTV